jgi:uncharacterized membrane protein YphA (DoxX/SURF4 family)
VHLRQCLRIANSGASTPRAALVACDLRLASVRVEADGVATTAGLAPQAPTTSHQPQSTNHKSQVALGIVMEDEQGRRIARWPLATLRVYVGVVFAIAGMRQLANMGPWVAAGQQWTSAVHDQLSTWEPHSATWYHGIVAQVLIPNVNLIAPLVAWSNLVVGAALTLGLSGWGSSSTTWRLRADASTLPALMQSIRPRYWLCYLPVPGARGASTPRWLDAGRGLCCGDRRDDRGQRVSLLAS